MVLLSVKSRRHIWKHSPSPWSGSWLGLAKSRCWWYPLKSSLSTAGTKKSPDHSPKCPESVGCPPRWFPKSGVAQGIWQGEKLVVSPSLMKPCRDVSSIKPLFPGTFLHACETSSSLLTFHFKDLWNMGRWYSGLSWIRNLLKTLNAITRSVFKTQRVIYLLLALSVCSLCFKLIFCWNCFCWNSDYLSRFLAFISFILRMYMNHFQT